MAAKRIASSLFGGRRLFGSPALWVTLSVCSAVAAACGSSDEHRATRGYGGASGQGGETAGAAQPSSGSGGDSNDATAGSSASGESSTNGGSGGETPLVGGNGSEPGGAGGAGGASGAGGTSAEGCLALHFGSDVDTVQIPDLTIPDFGSAGTIELWILPDEGQPNMLVAAGCLFNKWVNFQEDKFLYLNADGSLSVYFAQQAANFSSPAAVKPLAWQHVALAYDGTSARIYVDGIKVAEQAGASAPVNSDGNIQVGHVVRDITYPAVRGFYSELRLSNVARYTTTFTPAAHLAADTSTTGLWRLDEGSGTTAADASDLGNPGSIDGAKWQLAPCR